MLPAANPVGATVVKPSQPVMGQTAARAAQPQAPETARTSAGEAGAANVRAETPSAVQAAEQSAVAPRLRDQETAETTDRDVPTKDAPTGPPPSFEESPLERQARVALDPPEKSEAANAEDAPPPTRDEERSATTQEEPKAVEPPPTPTERAEVSFAETQSLAEPKGPATVDLAR